MRTTARVMRFPLLTSSVHVARAVLYEYKLEQFSVLCFFLRA